MKAELTDRLITKLKRGQPPEKEYEVRDTKVPGLVLRVKPSGKMVYTLVYARGKRVTIGPADAIDHDRARSIAKGHLAEHYSGNNPIKEKQKLQADNYLSFLEEFYKPHLKATLRKGRDNEENVAETMACLVRRFPEFHRLTLGEISPLLIDKWIHRRSEEVKPTSIKRQLNDLHACLSYATKRGLLSKNPFDELDAYETEESERVRYLSPDEEERLRKALDARELEMKARLKAAADGFVDHLKPAIIISLNTGLRRGELLKLKRQSIDFEQNILTVEAGTAKSAKTRRVPLNAEALSILKAWLWQKKESGVQSLFVFSDVDGQPFRDMRTSWEGLVARAALSDFRWHDLRHTFASKLAIAGIDIYRIKDLLGHTDIKMTSRYAHLQPQHMRDAVDSLCKPRTASM